MSAVRIVDVIARPLDVLFPPTCAACGLPGDPVCAGCRASLVPLGPVGCRRCGHPWPARVERCAECLFGIDAARQAVGYLPPAPSLVSSLKDGRRRVLAVDLAAVIAQQVGRPPVSVTLVPVPLAPRRAAERGFNQARLIADELGRRWGLPVAEILERRRDGPPQRGSSPTDRRLHVRGAFRVPPGRAAPAAVCLVDDVVTTGATLSACAAALRRAGVARVGAVAFARVLGGPATALPFASYAQAPGGPDGSSRQGSQHPCH